MSLPIDDAFALQSTLCRIGQVFGSQRVPTSANLADAANAAAHGVRAASSDSHGH